MDQNLPSVLGEAITMYSNYDKYDNATKTFKLTG